MKRNDLVLAGILLLLSITFWVVFSFFPKSTGSYIQITIDNTVYQTLPLSQNKTIKIPTAEHGETHYNTVQIQNGYARITDADCPDQLCVHQKKISKRGESIVCLPHKIIVSVLTNDKKQKTSLDGISQ